MAFHRAYKLVRAGVLTSAALLILLGGAAGYLLHEFWNANAWVQHTTEVISQVRAARTALGLAAGAGSRPDNIRANMAALREQVDRVAESTRDNAWQQENIADFRRLAFSALPDGELGALSADRMQAANTVLDRMQREEYGLLMQRSSLQQKSLEYSMAALGGLFTALLIVSIVSALLARNELRQRHAAEEILEKEKLELMRYTEELGMVSRGSELIQAAQSEEQMLVAVVQVLQHLLPGTSGIVGLVNSAQDTVHVSKSWGNIAAPESFPASACVALQVGRTVHRSAMAIHGACAHLGQNGDTLCVPVRSASGHLGVLHMQAAEVLNKESADSVALFAAHIGLGLTNLRMREALRSQSVHDALTGLFNRRYFDEILRHELAAAHRSGSVLSVLLFDLDYFKLCNDTHGHAAGDAVLQSFGNLLGSTFRDSDVVCRYGGEEFAAILMGADITKAYAKADSFRGLVEQTDLGLGNQDGESITTSVGAACSWEFPDAEELVKAADAALYEAKRAGRNTVRVCSSRAGTLPAVAVPAYSLLKKNFPASPATARPSTGLPDEPVQ